MEGYFIFFLSNNTKGDYILLRVLYLRGKGFFIIVV